MRYEVNERGKYNSTCDLTKHTCWAKEICFRPAEDRCLSEICCSLLFRCLWVDCRTTTLAIQPGTSSLWLKRDKTHLVRIHSNKGSIKVVNGGGHLFITFDENLNARYPFTNEHQMFPLSSMGTWQVVVVPESLSLACSIWWNNRNHFDGVFKEYLSGIHRHVCFWK